MATFLSKKVLQQTLFAALGTDADVREDKLEEWDDELRSKYEDALTVELPAHNIQNTKANRSMVVLLAEIGFRLGRTRTGRIRKACSYFNLCQMGRRAAPVPPVVAGSP